MQRRSATGSMGRFALGAVAAWLVAGLALVAGAPVARAADAVTFGDPSATSAFGKAIEFKQPVTVAGPPKRVEILIGTPGSIGPTVSELPAASASGPVLDYSLDLSNGNIVPNTTFTARWRVTDSAGKAWLGPIVTHVYADDRFDWKTLTGNVVRVHWTQGDQAFGKRALKIGDDAVAATARLLGVTESQPIDFFIYADQQSFYDALGPATRENVGGQAHPDIRTLFALITPADINASWVESVVPHELTHVVFQTAVDNPYHDPPHWLNEGLAVYLSDGYQDSDRQQVRQAASSGSIIPLDGLAGAFPTTQERFFLAYAESVSAVDRMVRVNGRDALVKLIRSYHDGVSDDEAFKAALGTDVAGFEAAWLAALGATPPTRLGPRPAPVGPLPSGWTGPQPDPSFEVTGSIPPVTPSAPLPSAPETDGFGPAVLRVSLIGLALVLVIAVAGVRRIRRRPDPARWAETGDNRLFWRPAADDAPSIPGAAPGPVDGGPSPSRLWSSSSTEWSLPREPSDPTRPEPAWAEPPAETGPRSPWDRPANAPAGEPAGPEQDAGRGEATDPGPDQTAAPPGPADAGRA